MIIFDLTKKIINRIFNNSKPKQLLKQEVLLRIALSEKGFELDKLEIKCDHLLGKNYVNGLEFSIKYPDSFYDKAMSIIPEEKNINFYFNGNMSENGGRANMLKPFINSPFNLIVKSEEGRNTKTKGNFNLEYYVPFASSKFGLCPHQADWPGNKDFMWTYRFIEACFVESIPIVFEEAPLGIKFLEGFNYFWKEQILDSNLKVAPPFYDKELAIKNRNLAKQKFCFANSECDLIWETVF